MEELGKKDAIGMEQGTGCSAPLGTPQNTPSC